MTLMLERPPDLPKKRDEIDAKIEQLATELGVFPDELKSDALAVLLYSLGLKDFDKMPDKKSASLWNDLIRTVVRTVDKEESAPDIKPAPSKPRRAAP